MWPYQMEKADIATVAFFTYPANKIRTALYQNSRLSGVWKRKEKKKRKKGDDYNSMIKQL